MDDSLPRATRAQTWSAEEQWRVGEEPELVAGLDKPGGHVLGIPQAAVLLSDGGVVVADNASHQLYGYDSAGQLRFSSGRDGKGPGEYKNLYGVWHTAADSLIVSDWDLSRISILTPDGKFVRSVAVPAIHGPGRGVALAHATHLLVHLDRAYVSQATGLTRDTIELGVLDIGTGALTRIGRFPGRESVRKRSGSSGLSMAAPFARATYAGGGAGRIVVGTSDSPVIRWSCLSNNLSGQFNAVREARPSMRREGWRFLEAQDSTEYRARVLRRMKYDGEAPPRVPYFDGLMVDEAGNTWLKLYAPPWVATQLTWDVYDPAGTWLGPVELPIPNTHYPKFDLLNVSNTHVLVMAYDALGVQTVQKYRLLKPAARTRSVDPCSSPKADA